VKTKEVENVPKEVKGVGGWEVTCLRRLCHGHQVGAVTSQALGST